MAQQFKVVYSDGADADLNALLHYYKNAFGEHAAVKILRTIRRKIDETVKYPEAFPPYSPNGRTFKRAYRYAIAGKKQRIVYTIFVSEKEIQKSALLMSGLTLES